jgi:shikimate dehydrogenase
VLNRSEARAEALAAALGPRLQAGGLGELEGALPAADLMVNATSAELGGGAALDLPWSAASPHLTAMDMTYRPLITSFLAGAQARGLTIVDGLEMLIGQARPSFEAFFGRPPPDALDVRAVALEAMRA